jgi:hypothetical protein
MWIIVPKESTDAVWETLKEETLFVLEGLVLPGVKKTKRLDCYRIVARLNNNCEVVVAVGADMFIIKQHWDVLQKQIMKSLSGLNERKDAKAISQLLLMKIGALTKVEVNQQVEQEEKMRKKLMKLPSYPSIPGSSTYFRTLFNLDESEKLLGCKHFFLLFIIFVSSFQHSICEYILIQEIATSLTTI